jgi:hypothetical protein
MGRFLAPASCCVRRLMLEGSACSATRKTGIRYPMLCRVRSRELFHLASRRHAGRMDGKCLCERSNTAVQVRQVRLARLGLPAQFDQFIRGFDSGISLDKDWWRLAGRMVTADGQLPVSEPAVLTA